MHRIVFADNNAQHETGTDPLSWSLTPKQRQEVRDTARGYCDPPGFFNPNDPKAPECDKSVLEKYDEAVKWFIDTNPWRGDSCVPE